MSAAIDMARSQAAIWERVVRPAEDDFPVEAARTLLKLGFDAVDRERMHELAAKGQRGALTAAEEAELEDYCRVGRVLDLMHAKARRSLKRAGQRP